MNTATQTQTGPCPKCLGVGSFSAFAHIASGVCFRCKGAKVTTETVRAAPVVVASVFTPDTATPYAVNHIEDPYRIGGNLSWEEACDIVDRCTAQHVGQTYEVIKFVDGQWTTRAGVILPV